MAHTRLLFHDPARQKVRGRGEAGARGGSRSSGRAAALRPALLLALAAMAGLVGAAPAAGDEPPVAAVTAEGTAEAAALLPNGRAPLPGVLTGGQPTREQLAAIAAAGYRTVVDLRTAEEAAPGMEELARELGLRHVRLPVAGAADLTAAKADELGTLLADATAYPLVIHCASGNRVGALLALEQARVAGKAPEEALRVGLDAGLKALEPAVRELLGLPPR